MNLVLNEQALQGADLNDEKLRLELAVALYRNQKLTLRQVSRLAELSRIAFQRELGLRGESLNYDEEEFLKDMENIKSFTTQ